MRLEWEKCSKRNTFNTHGLPKNEFIWLWSLGEFQKSARIRVCYPSWIDDRAMVETRELKTVLLEKQA